jgi:hypothetical protein
MAARNSCYKMIPCKVSVGDWNKLDNDFRRRSSMLLFAQCRMGSPQVWMGCPMSSTRQCGIQ